MDSQTPPRIPRPAFKQYVGPRLLRSHKIHKYMHYIQSDVARLQAQLATSEHPDILQQVIEIRNTQAALVPLLIDLRGRIIRDEYVHEAGPDDPRFQAKAKMFYDFLAQFRNTLVFVPEHKVAYEDLPEDLDEYMRQNQRMIDDAQFYLKHEMLNPLIYVDIQHLDWMRRGRYYEKNQTPKHMEWIAKAFELFINKTVQHIIAIVVPKNMQSGRV